MREIAWTQEKGEEKKPRSKVNHWCIAPKAQLRIEKNHCVNEYLFRAVPDGNILVLSEKQN